MTYPVVDHRKIAPQPEYCELCGERRPGAEFIRADVEGLRGLLICATTPSCRKFRNRLSWRDRWRTFRAPTTIGIGKHPVFDAGDEDWIEIVEPTEPWP